MVTAAAREAAADTVTVVCKLPWGLVCDVVDMASFEAAKPKMKAREPYVIGRKGKFRIRGYGEARGIESAGTIETEARHVIGKFGITQNVPKDLWEEWLAQNTDFPPVKNGLIYASYQTSSAEDYAREHAELKTGFDALSHEKPAPGIEPANYEGMSSDARKKAQRGMPDFTG